MGRIYQITFQQNEHFSEKSVILTLRIPRVLEPHRIPGEGGGRTDPPVIS